MASSLHRPMLRSLWAKRRCYSDGHCEWVYDDASKTPSYRHMDDDLDPSDLEPEFPLGALIASVIVLVICTVIYCYVYRKHLRAVEAHRGTNEQVDDDDEKLSDEQKKAYLDHVQQQCVATTMTVTNEDLGPCPNALLQQSDDSAVAPVKADSEGEKWHQQLLPRDESSLELSNNDNNDEYKSDDEHNNDNDNDNDNTNSPSSDMTRDVGPQPISWLRLPPHEPNGNRCVANSCAICLESYDPPQQVTWCPLRCADRNEDLATTGCPHAFHTECFQEYVNAVIQNDSVNKAEGIPCPLCRQPFVVPPPAPSSGEEAGEPGTKLNSPPSIEEAATVDNASETSNSASIQP